MKPFYNKALLAAGWLLSAFLLHPSSMRAQGSLTPTGAPASTMKSLSQIEPRTPVDAVNTPSAPDEQFTITQPGSYYLTGNMTGASGVLIGILIQANDVTLDLNGFALTGAGNDEGIVVDYITANQNIVIRNGTLRNWANGVDDLNGCCKLENVRVYGCASDGFELGDHCAVRNCAAVSNAGSGIQIGNDCQVTDCIVVSNVFGISGGRGCIIRDCQASANDNGGIAVGDDFSVSQCTAAFNDFGIEVGNNGRIVECVADTNANIGIAAGTGVTVRDCTASGNVFWGINIEGDNSVVIDNQACFNGYSGISSGLDYDFSVNRLEHNQTLGNGQYGIFSSGTDIVVRNSSNGNGNNNYIPSAGTSIAPVETPSTATSPWANF